MTLGLGVNAEVPEPAHSGAEVGRGSRTVCNNGENKTKLGTGQIKTKENPHPHRGWVPHFFRSVSSPYMSILIY